MCVPPSCFFSLSSGLVAVYVVVVGGVVGGGVAVAVRLVCCSRERFQEDEPKRARFCDAMNCEK